MGYVVHYVVIEVMDYIINKVIIEVVGVATLAQLTAQFPKTQPWHTQIQPEGGPLHILCMSQSVTG